MEIFENRLLGRTVGSFREQATWEDILKFLDNRLLGGHLEVFMYRLLGRTFGGLRGQATAEDNWMFSTKGY